MRLRYVSSTDGVLHMSGPEYGRKKHTTACRFLGRIVVGEGGGESFDAVPEDIDSLSNVGGMPGGPTFGHQNRFEGRHCGQDKGCAVVSDADVSTLGNYHCRKVFRIDSTSSSCRLVKIPTDSWNISRSVASWTTMTSCVVHIKR